MRNYETALCPYLPKTELFLTCNLISKSPSKFPFLGSLMVMPSLTPRGMVISSFTLFFSTPLPLQVGQKCLIFSPAPPQDPQVVCMTNMPCRIVCIPDPSQLRHFSGCVPGLHLLPLHPPQTTRRSNYSTFVQPLTLSSKVRDRFMVLV
jgi:hypothetical protein